MINYGLQGKVAVVTGAGSGIGKSTAGMFAEQGCKVALIGRGSEALQKVKDAISAAGGVAEAFPSDVGNDASVQIMSEAVLKRFGNVDIVANIAGVEVDFKKADGMEHHGLGDPFSISKEEWCRVMDTNVRGHFNTMKFFTPGMRKNHFGRIVNVTSATAFSVPIGTAAYVGSKAAANTQTYLFAKKLGPNGITVNAIAPGYVETPMQNESSEASKARIAQSTPLQRVCMPDDVARAVLFFAQENLFITGQVLIVDGGSYPR